MEQQRVSRMGTARALVLLGSAVALAASAAACFVALVFAPVLRQEGFTGPVVLAVVVFVAIILLSIALANLLALRAASTRAVVAGGCATLLVGVALGIAALLVLITLG